MHSEILTALTLKSCEKKFLLWTQKFEDAFQSIKNIVVLRECLTVIDHDDKSKKIFLTTDASDTVSGAVLSFSETWESAHPVVFNSMTFKVAELNYPIHEKELLAIMRALCVMNGSPHTFSFYSLLSFLCLNPYRTSISLLISSPFSSDLVIYHIFIKFFS